MSLVENKIKVPALDLKAQYLAIKDEIDDAVMNVLNSQQFILGPKVEECEHDIADYCGVQHAVGVSSGTDALLACLMAEQIGPGDEVITTTYSFFATAGCIARVGATPVFVDIDRNTYNIDPDLIERKISPRTRAIIPVHLYGYMADMGPIMEIADRHNLIVIEDAAQAIGAEYFGRRAGSIGHYGCFSFFPAKNLGTAGDGGMIVTKDLERASKLRVLRVHGSKPKYFHGLIGGNFRLDAIHAAIVTVKLKHLDRWTSLRQKIAKRYSELFSQCGLERLEAIEITPALKTPLQPEHRHVVNQYVIRARNRDKLLRYLSNQNIETAVYYPRSLHEQECFSYLGCRTGDYSESELASAETLALPLYPELDDDKVDFVVRSVDGFYQSFTEGSACEP